MKKLSDAVSKMKNVESTYKLFMSEKVMNDAEIQNFIKKNNFTDEDIIKHAEKFYQYYISKDINLKINHIPRLSYRDGEVYINYAETEEYKQQRLSQQMNNRIKTEFIPKKVLTYTFENLSKTKEKAEVATKIIQDCNNILSGNSKKGVYIYGPTGVGKTYLMGCIYNYLKTEGKEPTILYYPEFIRKMKNKITSNDQGEYIDLIRNDEILIIDDIGAENITEYIRDEILGPIINYREAENLPTFFSSNLDFKDLVELLSNSKVSVDYTKAVRIVERIKSLSKEYYLDGKSERDYRSN